MFLLYHLGTCLEDVLIVGLHIDKFRLYYLLVKFKRSLDNVLQQFLLANDKKNNLQLSHKRLQFYLLIFLFVLAKQYTYYCSLYVCLPLAQL